MKTIKQEFVRGDYLSIARSEKGDASTHHRRRSMGAVGIVYPVINCPSLSGVRELEKLPNPQLGKGLDISCPSVALYVVNCPIGC